MHFRRQSGIAGSIVLILSANMFFLPMTAKSDALGDAAGQAKNIMGQLNPINLAFGPLIDRAVADGDSALQARLEQLHAIIQEALYSLDQIAQKRIAQVDDSLKNRLNQLQQITNQSIAEFNALADGRIRQIDDALAARIDQFGNTVGNVVASLPIPTDPILNVGKAGISTARQKGEYTVVYVSGSGLFKNGTKPEAYLFKRDAPGPETTSWFKHAGEPVNVASSSMGLVEIRIPNRLMPQGTTAETFTLQLRLRRGTDWLVVPSYSEPTLPMHICGSLRPYSAELQISASGNRWDRRVIPFPGSSDVKGHHYGFYITNSEKNYDRCAREADSEGYTLDESPQAGYSNGLSVGSEGGDHYHQFVMNYPRPGCFHLYADDRNGNSNEWIGEVMVKQRKLTSVNECSPATKISKRLLYGQNNQMTIKLSDIIGACAEEGTSASPVVHARLVIKDANGQDVETADLLPNVPRRMLDGTILAQLTDQGLFSATLDTGCKWSYAVVTATK